MATAPWQQYQRDVATLLDELGFTSVVEDELISARGVTHEVDVSARRTVAGVDILWIAECKRREDRVKKEMVATLAAIGEDLGVDRCLMMSESGFQSGAIQMAAGRSITLTNLQDLRAAAVDDLLTSRRHQAERRLLAMEEHPRSWKPGTKWGELPALRVAYLAAAPEKQERAAAASHAFPCQTDQEIVELQCELNSVALKFGLADADEWIAGVDVLEAETLTRSLRSNRAALDQAIVGRWPVLVADLRGHRHAAFSLRQLLDVIEPVLAALQARVSAQTDRIRAAHATQQNQP